MFRASPLSLFGMVFIAVTPLAAANPPEANADRFNQALSVQTAMVRARIVLTDKDTKKAVEILEDQLPKVNGNTEYLILLRDAYRAHIKDLYFAGKPEQARRYLDRLCILDPNAANDPALRPQVETPPRKFEPEPAKTVKLMQFPNFKMPTLTNPFAKKEEAKKAAVIRAQAEDASTEDPFDRKNQREPLTKAKSNVSARELLSRAAEEFKLERYHEARRSFELAYQADQSSMDACREQWAYCIIKGVNDAMNQSGPIPDKFTDLKQQVENAIGMAPAKFMAVGQGLLQQLDQRAKLQPTGPPLVTGSLTNVKHLGSNAEGWSVAKTPHFFIYHRQNDEFAERVAQVAESTRQTMYRRWFGHDGIEWEPICELIMHENSAGYTQMTGVPSNSPGHSRIVSDPAGRVISRRMDMRLDIHNIMETVLPHETTHVVLAGMFGSSAVPRWADEGMAVLSEPEEKIAQHRRNLVKHSKDEQLFGLKELMELQDYPQPRRITAFYAQSVVLVEFLANQRGHKVFAEFVKDGLRSGYESALQRHYNVTFTQLEQTWQQQVLGNAERFASQK